MTDGTSTRAEQPAGPGLRSAGPNKVRGVSKSWLWVLLWAVACGNATQDSTSHPGHNSRSSSVWQVQSFPGVWTYRLGSSPRMTSGDWLWAQPDYAASDWQRTAYPGKTPLEYGQREMWIRVRLIGPKLEKPTLFLPLAGYATAFLDGKQLAMEELPHHIWEESRSHDRRFLLHLGTDYVGQNLSIHLRSNAPRIGVISVPYLGEPVGVICEILRNAVPFLILTALTGLLALTTIALFLVSRRDPILLYFSSTCLLMSIYFVGLSGLLGWFFKTPPPSNILYNLAGPLVVVSIWTFVMHVLGHRYSGFFFWIRNILLISSIVEWIVAFSYGAHSIDLMLRPINILILIGMLLAMFILIRCARDGVIDARIMSIGQALATVIAIPDILVLTGIWAHQTQYLFMQLSCVVFLMALGLVPIRRFMATYRKLNEYSELLSAQVATLGRRNKEIQTLNEELRRQIEQRSDRMIDLLTRSRSSINLPPIQEMAVGDLLGEHYRVVCALGRGAMGIVYEVERLSDSLHLAAKLLVARSDRSVMIRFIREARILAQLQHPNLVAITDIDITNDGTLYLVMELVRGKSLKEAKEHFRDLQFSKTVLRQICLGLQLIHSKGIVHRDLKPANVLLAETPAGFIAKIADFGISTFGKELPSSSTSDNSSQKNDMQAIKMLPYMHENSNSIGDSDNDTSDIPIGFPQSNTENSESVLAPIPESNSIGAGIPAQIMDSENLTQTGMLLGTPFYMAPELASGSRKAAPSSDIFSLGVIAFELFSGKLPFSIPPVLSVWQKRSIAAAPLKQQQPDLSEEIATLFDRCLAREPDVRPTLQALIDAL